MFTNKEIMEIALKQSAEDNNCQVEDFLKNKNVIITHKLGSNARNYYKEPIACNFISYGNNVVAATKENI